MEDRLMNTMARAHHAYWLTSLQIPVSEIAVILSWRMARKSSKFIDSDENKCSSTFVRYQRRSGHSRAGMQLTNGRSKYPPSLTRCAEARDLLSQS
jgi:hypothetical protein